MSVANFRKYKIFGMAIFDLFTAMLGTVLLLLLFKHIHYQNLNNTHFIIAGILLAIPIGIIFHIIFGVNTFLNYKLGLSNSRI
jgi:predicted membrane protein